MRTWINAVVVGRMMTGDHWLSIPELLSPGLGTFPDGSVAWLVGVVVGFFALSLILWLIVTVAEGAQIGVVFNLQSGRRLSMRRALDLGWRYLGRFVGVDTIVFFPLFLLALSFMLLVVVSVVGATAVYLSAERAGQPLQLLATGAICLLPLLLLFIFAGVLTPLFRTLAFREVVVEAAGVRQSIRQAWQIMRRHLGTLLLLAALLWGVRYLSGLLLALVSVPLVSAVSIPLLLNVGEGAGSLLFVRLVVQLAFAVMVVFTVIVHSLLSAFTNTVWTLAYIERLRDGEPGMPEVIFS